MRNRRFGVAALALGITLVGLHSTGYAKDPKTPPAAVATGSGAPSAPKANVQAQIMVLHGSSGGGGIDPKIGNLPQLKKPPFSAYNTYKLLRESKLGLPMGDTMSSPLPDGSSLKLTFRDVNAVGRYKIAATIEKPDGTTFVKLVEIAASVGEPFFLAGQHYKDSNQDGILVIGIKLNK